MDEVVFASHTGVRLVLTPAPRPHDVGRAELPTWEARLAGEGLNASIICPEAGWEPQSLTDFLAALDDDWRGWNGERSWQSEDGELRLVARHNQIDTVTISAVMEDGAPPRWRCEAELELDPGGFKQLAALTRRLAEVSLTL